MPMPAGLPVFDTMIGFPREGFGQYDFIRRQTRDKGSIEEMQFPAAYMFKNVPKDLPTAEPVAVTLHEMDRFNITGALTRSASSPPPTSRCPTPATRSASSSGRSSTTPGSW